MSRVYFHTPTQEAELLGPERYWAGHVADSITTGFITPTPGGGEADILNEMLPPGHYARRRSGADPAGFAQWANTFLLAWRAGVDLHWREHRLGSWLFTLNTAIAVGNDPVRFLTRVHAQCELHAWVDGPDREWLAGIITAGLRSGVYRPGMGWDNVIALLLVRDDEPVVMSHSVTDQFPNPYATTLVVGEDPDAWYDLPTSEKWAGSMEWLRSQPGGLQITPANLASLRFGHGLTVFDLLAPDRDDRFTAALGGAG
jgi:hypothetical protein